MSIDARVKNDEIYTQERIVQSKDSSQNEISTLVLTLNNEDKKDMHGEARESEQAQPGNGADGTQFPQFLGRVPGRMGKWQIVYCMECINT